MSPPLHIQETPKQPEYAAASIQVPANIATAQATMDNVKAGQSQLNSVNNFTGGRSRRARRGRQTKRDKREFKHKSFIRTYKGRKYLSQKGGSGVGGAQDGGAIAVPQVGSPCAGGPQCAGAQNASFTSIHNQAMSNGSNDAYASQSGGRRNVRFSKHHVYYRHRDSSHSRKPRHDQSLTSMIAYNIKKVMRKVFS
jgi:hypothetical protein